MRKLSLFMLMAVGLLISGNLRADNVCKIVDGQEYESLQEAFDAVPTNGPQTEIQLIANIESEITSGNAYAIAENKNVVLDLNGHSIRVTATNNANTSVIVNAGTLEIKDSQTGGLIWLKSYVKDNNGSATILNIHDLTITSGTIQNATVTSSGAWYYIAYAIDNAVNWPTISGYHTQWHDITCTINGGHIISHGADGYIVPAIRLYDQCHENNVTLTMNGGIVEGQRGIYIQKASRTATADQIKVYINDGTIIGHGNTSNGDRPWAIDVETDSNSPKATFDAVEINITGGTIDGKISLGRNNSGTELGCEKLDIKGGNFTYHNAILNGHTNNDFYEGCPTLQGCISGGKFFFNPNAGEQIRTAYVTEIQFASDWGGEYAKGYDQFNKYYGDLANRAGWEALGYTVESITTPSGKTGSWHAIVKYSASMEDYSNFLPYIADDHIALDITGTTEGRIDGQKWPAKTVIVKPITETQMSETKDWNPGETDGSSAVVVESGAVVTIPANTTVEAYSVNVTNGTLNIGEGATLIVGAGGVIEDATISINIGGENGSGAIKISPDATTNNKPRVRVKLATKAHVDGEGNYHWQYFARPTGITPESFTVVVPSDANKHFIYGYHGATNDYEPISDFTQLDNYQGYAITNNSTNGGVVYQFEGQLNANEDADLKFVNSNFTLLGNSYLAPVSMDGLFAGIREATHTEESVIEYTIWIYEHDQKRFVQTNQLQANRKKSTAQLQPMQGFFMRLMSGSSLTTEIDYVGAVWNNNVQAKPILAPARNQTSDIAAASVVISANGCADQVDLFEDVEFDNTFNNGADASKLMNINNMFNLYAETEVGTLSCVASDNLEGTILTFQANNASEYELSFKDVENMNYSLIDLVANRVIRMNEVYTFNATPNSTEERFQIVSAAQTPTMMDKVIYKKAAKGIYSMTGAYFGEVRNFNTLPSGVYVVNGEMIVK